MPKETEPVGAEDMETHRLSPSEQLDLANSAIMGRISIAKQSEEKNWLKARQADIDEHAEQSIMGIMPESAHVLGKDIYLAIKLARRSGVRTLSDLANISEEDFEEIRSHHRRPKNMLRLIRDKAVALELVQKEEQGLALFTEDFPDILMDGEIDLYNYLKSDGSNTARRVAFSDYQTLQQIEFDSDLVRGAFGDEIGYDKSNSERRAEELIYQMNSLKTDIRRAEFAIPGYKQEYEEIENLCENMWSKKGATAQSHKKWVDKLHQFSEWILSSPGNT